MRITDLSVMLNANRIKTNQEQDKKGSVLFKTGDVVEGKVLEAEGKSLVLMLNSGKLLQLQDMGNNNHQLGDALKMELVKEGEVLMGKVVDEPVSTMADKESLSETALKQIGLESTEERKTVAKLLRLNDLPITKENVTLLTEAKKYVTRLSDLVKNNMLDASKLPIDKNVKTILVEHLNKSDQLYVAPKEGTGSTVKDLILAETELQRSPASTEAQSKLEQVAEKATPYVVERDGTVSKATANAFLSEKLDQVAYKSLVFNLKNNVENTVKNLVLLDKVILGSDSVTKQLERFSKNIKYIFNKSNISQSTHPDLFKQLAKFQEMPIKDYEAFEKAANKLIETMKETSSMSSIDKAVIASQVATIRNSLSYLNDMSQNLVFVQMPVQVNEHVQNMDLYIKKNPNRKKVDPNHCSIFLSLDTERCHTVKSLLEINHEKASITFKLKDEATVDYFNEHLDALKESLKEKGYFNVMLNAIEYQADEMNVLEEELPLSEHYIDVKL
ncbi:MAG: hypothetical protein JXO44_12310 [Clostridia bacterium]|nr:hypothetical protein [Clostridia bacterium]